jgi:hypothetical protein
MLARHLQEKLSRHEPTGSWFLHAPPAFLIPAFGADLSESFVTLSGKLS